MCPEAGQTCGREKTQGRLPTVAYADAFGAAGAGGTLTYYLATAFDKVCSLLCATLGVGACAWDNQLRHRKAHELTHSGPK